LATLDERPYSRLDFGFAHFMGERSRLQGESRNRFESILLELSAQQTAGHCCIELTEEDEALAAASGLVSAQDLTPLIIERRRLYLHRYWQYEQNLAQRLTAISRQTYAIEGLEDCLANYFPVQDSEFDWQKQAARCALSQGLTVITGGPGTGKTTTVVKILALLQETAGATPHIALAAPTGKAAMRLQEAIAANKAALPCPESVTAHIPDKVATLHRLLGPQPPSPYFLHSAKRPLPHDLLVIDESSMVDLALMSKLVDAIKPGARLILLGDKDQLASVESGAVLADLTQSLPRHTVELVKSHRFQGGIKALANAVNRQQADLAWRLLTGPAADAGLLRGDPIDYIAENYLDYLRLIRAGADFPSIFAAFNRFKVLCANRQGPYSVADVNFRVARRLAASHNIQISGAWYAGRPIMITANNPGLQLFNGDIGLCLADPESGGQLRAFFLRSDGSVKKLQPARIHDCETVYAMTIHKSQGSEFERVLILLPEQSNPVLSKELLYTAITRAKNQVRIVGGESVFKTAVAHKVLRHSGLAEKLITLNAEQAHEIG
jgi:exodeoxyribonuclease V alpha subunit